MILRTISTAALGLFLASAPQVQAQTTGTEAPYPWVLDPAQVLKTCTYEQTLGPWVEKTTAFRRNSQLSDGTNQFNYVSEGFVSELWFEESGFGMILMNELVYEPGDLTVEAGNSVGVMSYFVQDRATFLKVLREHRAHLDYEGADGHGSFRNYALDVTVPYYDTLRMQLGAGPGVDYEKLSEAEMAAWTTGFLYSGGKVYADSADPDGDGAALQAMLAHLHLMVEYSAELNYMVDGYFHGPEVGDYFGRMWRFNINGEELGWAQEMMQSEGKFAAFRALPTDSPDCPT